MQCLLVVLMIPMIDTISLISVKTQVVLHSLELRPAAVHAAVLASVCTAVLQCWPLPVLICQMTFPAGPHRGPRRFAAPRPSVRPATT